MAHASPRQANVDNATNGTSRSMVRRHVGSGRRRACPRPTIVLNGPIKLSNDPAGVYRDVSRLNQHSDKICAELEANWVNRPSYSLGAKSMWITTTTNKADVAIQKRVR